MARSRRALRDFGEALAEALMDRGWTQRDLGEALGGTTQSAISAWRSGAAEPAPSTVFAIEDALGVVPGTLSRLLGYMPASGSPGVPLSRVIHLDPFLSEAEKRGLLALYRELRRGRRPSPPVVPDDIAP